MASSLSVGDFFGDHLFPSHRFLSPLRSDFPTGILRSKFSWVSTGGFSLSILFDSYLSPFLTGVNHLPKPPWKPLYNPFTISLSLLHFPIRLFPLSIQQTFPMSDFLRKSVQDLDLGIDDVPVALPSEFCSQAASVNRFSIVVTTLNQRKHNLRALIGQIPRVWGFPNSWVGRIMGRGRVQFRFQSEESMNLVLRRGPWSFSDWMLSTHRWHPHITEEDMKIIPFWVQIEGIPILYLTTAMAGFVGSKLGHVMEVDYDENVYHVGSVWVRIAWNRDNLLCFQRNFQFVVGENTIIKYRFERLRTFLAMHRWKYWRQGGVGIAQIGRLENASAMLRWVLIDMRGSSAWDDLVNLFVVKLKRITQSTFFKETLVRKCWCHYVYLSGLALDTSALMLRFVIRSHSHKLLFTIRNKEISNMKLDNNRSFDWLASKATLRKASSNSLLLYFLLVYGSYICVCNNCVSLILYVFVITLLD